MKSTISRIGLLFAALFLAIGPVLANDDDKKDDTDKDIIEVAVEAGTFKTLAAALEAGGLIETLKGDGPFTVFAPTDEAFAKLPEGTVEELLKPENKDKLVSILTYHVVPGKVMAGDLLSTAGAKTVNGQKAPIGLTIAGANIIKTDIEASNGVIHVIDTVMLP